MTLTDREYFLLKREGKSFRKKQDVSVKPNGRSADFILSNIAGGCDYYCSYCATSRHRSLGNPITIYTNLDAITTEAIRYLGELGEKKIPNQCDRKYWTIDIGEAYDCLGPSLIDRTQIVIDRLTRLENVKVSFASKVTCPSRVKLLSNIVGTSKERRVRIRASLSPQSLIDKLEVGTSRVIDRLRGLNLSYQLGYECHINFSPIVLYPNWVEDYIELFSLVNKELDKEVKEQLKLECIFLTHHPKMHEMNMEYKQEAEALLWVPPIQETKTNERGDSQVVRYKALTIKKAAIVKFKELLNKYLPYAEIRYIF
ncbi:hypothetical protein H6G33_10230 [Calothrix sp. FACHB-1219]|uniref:spore photoproduct lyase family protein n=1 Tax=unclassified Calothrix TaxID=2619626 RepID=UPI0016854182|nr:MULTISPECIES: hypothetical protein [unclassified Calothrix]MBD2201724.1 hypothetical protein [Calothrix sp. FACHB-168]MBD2217410.1 hypothetical protein [Calothrix sp. FACHB-1219]